MKYTLVIVLLLNSFYSCSENKNIKPNSLTINEVNIMLTESIARFWINFGMFSSIEPIYILKELSDKNSPIISGISTAQKITLSDFDIFTHNCNKINFISSNDVKARKIKSYYNFSISKRDEKQIVIGIGYHNYKGVDGNLPLTSYKEPFHYGCFYIFEKTNNNWKYIDCMEF